MVASRLPSQERLVRAAHWARAVQPPATVVLLALRTVGLRQSKAVARVRFVREEEQAHAPEHRAGGPLAGGAALLRC